MLQSCFGLPVLEEGQVNIEDLLHQRVVAIIVQELVLESKGGG